ncbi:MAG: hypothetical protein KDA87_24250, partial [Planctomycetales bacterium]|nr:hypothetical protein [Planctomycetales bacterium]
WFNQADLVYAFQQGQYESGLPADWSQGDWDGAPREGDQPPVGDGLFNSVDLVRAFTAGNYRRGPYDEAAGEPLDGLAPFSRGNQSDTGLVYDSQTGGLRFESNHLINSVSLFSAAGIFTGTGPAPLHPFDVGNDNNELFRLVPSGATSISYGWIARPGLTLDELYDDLLIEGSRFDGGGLGEVTLKVCDFCVASDFAVERLLESQRAVTLTYAADTGEIAIESHSSAHITAIELTSDSGIFIGERPTGLDSQFDAVTESKLLWYSHFAHHRPRAGSQFSFGSVAKTGLSLETLQSDLHLRGFFAGSSAFGEVTIVVCEDCIDFEQLQPFEPGNEPFMAGDSNDDFYFMPGDIVLAFQAGEFEDTLAGNSEWIEGDWSDDGEFDSVDLIAAISSNAYGIGAYNEAATPLPLDERFPITMSGDGDVVITYDQSNGDVDIVSTVPLTTFYLHSASAYFEYDDSTTLLNVSGGHHFFRLTPEGQVESHFPGALPANMDVMTLVEDLTVNGSRFQGGDLGNVVLHCRGCQESVAGDLNNDTKVDAVDIDLLCLAIRNQDDDEQFDLDLDGNIDERDQTYLIESILGTVIGDVDLDGIFDSSDLVRLFQSATYENPDVVAGWSTGDWNCDQRFDSADLVMAFSANGYSYEARMPGQTRQLQLTDLALKDNTLRFVRKTRSPSQQEFWNE